MVDPVGLFILLTSRIFPENKENSIQKITAQPTYYTTHHEAGGRLCQFPCRSSAAHRKHCKEHFSAKNVSPDPKAVPTASLANSSEQLL